MVIASPPPAGEPVPPPRTAVLAERRAARRERGVKSRFQRRWLGTYWAGFGLSGVLATWSCAGLALGADVEPSSVGSVCAGAAAVGLGAVLATRLARQGPPDALWVHGTSTVRMICVGWIVLWLGMVAGAVVGVRAGDVVGIADGLLGAVGPVALLAVIGPGYGEYSECRNTSGLDSR